MSRVGDDNDSSSSSSDESDDNFQVQIKQEPVDSNGNDEEESSNERDGRSEQETHSLHNFISLNQFNVEFKTETEEDETWDPDTSITSPVQLSEGQLQLQNGDGTITNNEFEQLLSVRKYKPASTIRPPASKHLSSIDKHATGDKYVIHDIQVENQIIPKPLSERQLKRRKKEGTITQDELEQLRSIWKKSKLRYNSTSQKGTLPVPKPGAITGDDAHSQSFIVDNSFKTPKVNFMPNVDDSLSSDGSEVSLKVKQEPDSSESDENIDERDDGSGWEPESPLKVSENAEKKMELRSIRRCIPSVAIAPGPRASKRIASRVQQHTTDQENSKDEINKEIKISLKPLSECLTTPEGDGENPQLFTVENISGTLKVNGFTEGVLRKKKRTTGLTPTEDLMLKALYREHSRLKRQKEKMAKDQFGMKPQTKPKVKSEESKLRKRDRERERYSQMTPEQMAARSARRKQLRDAKSDEWKREASQKRQMKRLMMTEEEKRVVKFKAMVANLERKSQMTEEDKELQREKYRQRWSTFTPEQKAFVKAKANRTWRQNLSEEKKAKYCYKLRKKYHEKRGQVLNNPSKWVEAEENYQRTQQRYRELGIPKAVVVRGLSEEEKAARKKERNDLLDKVLGRRTKSMDHARIRLFTRPARSGTVKDKIAKLMQGGMNMYQARRHLQTPEQRERYLRQVRITKAKKVLRNKLQQTGARPEEVDAELSHLIKTYPERKRRSYREVWKPQIPVTSVPPTTTEGDQEPVKCNAKESTPFPASVEYALLSSSIPTVPTQLQTHDVLFSHPPLINNQPVTIAPVPFMSTYQDASAISNDFKFNTDIIPPSADQRVPKPTGARRVGRPRIHPITQQKRPLDPQSDLNAPCELCGKLMAKRMIHLHKRYSHNPHWVNSSCSLCSINFPNVYKFDHHYRATHGDLFPSTYPYRRSRTKADVPQPWSGKRVNPTTVCSYCGLEVSKVNLDIHIKRRHTDERDHYQCPVCPKKFKDERVMKAHHDKHHPEQEPLLCTRVSCSRCTARFGNLEELKFHAELTHPKEYYACPTCKVFRFSKETIKFHIMRCSSGAANLAKIEFPPELAETTAINHMMTKCEVCDKTMVLGSLRAHVKDMHGIVEEKLRCFRCDKTFKQHVFLVDHLDYCHGLRAEAVMEQVSRLHIDDKESEQFKEKLANPPMPPHKRPEYYVRRKERRRERMKLRKEGIMLPKRYVRSPALAKGERVRNSRKDKGVKGRRKIKKRVKAKTEVDSDTEDDWTSEDNLAETIMSQTLSTRRSQRRQIKVEQPNVEMQQPLMISVERLNDNEIKIETI